MSTVDTAESRAHKAKAELRAAQAAMHEMFPDEATGEVDLDESHELLGGASAGRGAAHGEKPGGKIFEVIATGHIGARCGARQRPGEESSEDDADADEDDSDSEDGLEALEPMAAQTKTADHFRFTVHRSRAGADPKSVSFTIPHKCSMVELKQKAREAFAGNGTAVDSMRAFVTMDISSAPRALPTAAAGVSGSQRDAFQHPEHYTSDQLEALGLPSVVAVPAAEAPLGAGGATGADEPQADAAAEACAAPPAAPPKTPFPRSSWPAPMEQLICDILAKFAEINGRVVCAPSHCGLMDAGFVRSSPLSEANKEELASGMVAKLTEITGSAGQIVAEYMLTMVENGKAMGQIDKALVELMGEDEATLLVEELYRLLLALDAASGSPQQGQQAVAAAAAEPAADPAFVKAEAAGAVEEYVVHMAEAGQTMGAIGAGLALMMARTSLAPLLIADLHRMLLALDTASLCPSEDCELWDYRGNKPFANLEPVGEHDLSSYTLLESRLVDEQDLFLNERRIGPLVPFLKQPHRDGTFAEFVPPAGECPAGHALEIFRSPIDVFRADAEVLCSCCDWSVPRGTLLQGCRICNFDLCLACTPLTHDGPGTHAVDELTADTREVHTWDSESDPIADCCATHLANSLRTNNSVQCVNIGATHSLMTVAGATALARAILRPDSNVTQLELEDWRDCQQVAAVARALRGTTSLSCLKLSACNLTGGSAEALVDAIRGGVALKELHFVGMFSRMQKRNSRGSECAVLADCLRSSRSGPEFLSLRDSFGELGSDLLKNVIEIVRSLESNTTLASLQLQLSCSSAPRAGRAHPWDSRAPLSSSSSAKMPYELLEALEIALRSNSTLTSLDLSYTHPNAWQQTAAVELRAKGYVGHNAEKLGVFELQEGLVRGRPAYKKPGKKLFLFWDANDNWLVGPDTSKPHGTWAAQCDALSPHAITKTWIVSNSKEKWVKVPAAQIVAVPRDDVRAKELARSLDSNAELVCAMLSAEGSALRQLNLSRCLTKHHANAIANAIAANPKSALQSLDLSGSKFDETGWSNIAEKVIRTNTTLTTLKINEVGAIGNRSAFLIAESLRSNTTLTDLGNCAGWRCDGEIYMITENLLRRNRGEGPAPFLSEDCSDLTCSSYCTCPFAPFRVTCEMVDLTFSCGEDISFRTKACMDFATIIHHYEAFLKGKKIDARGLAYFVDVGGSSDSRSCTRLTRTNRDTTTPWSVGWAPVESKSTPACQLLDRTERRPETFTTNLSLKVRKAEGNYSKICGEVHEDRNGQRWRVYFYPKGNNADGWVSLYIELINPRREFFRRKLWIFLEPVEGAAVPHKGGLVGHTFSACTPNRGYTKLLRRDELDPYIHRGTSGERFIKVAVEMLPFADVHRPQRPIGRNIIRVEMPHMIEKGAGDKVVCVVEKIARGEGGGDTRLTHFHVKPTTTLRQLFLAFNRHVGLMSACATDAQRTLQDTAIRALCSARTGSPARKVFAPLALISHGYEGFDDDCVLDWLDELDGTVQSYINEDDDADWVDDDGFATVMFSADSPLLSTLNDFCDEKDGKPNALNVGVVLGFAKLPKHLKTVALEEARETLLGAANGLAKIKGFDAAYVPGLVELVKDLVTALQAMIPMIPEAVQAVITEASAPLAAKTIKSKKKKNAGGAEADVVGARNDGRDSLRVELRDTPAVAVAVAAAAAADAAAAAAAASAAARQSLRTALVAVEAVHDHDAAALELEDIDPRLRDVIVRCELRASARKSEAEAKAAEVARRAAKAAAAAQEAQRRAAEMKRMQEEGEAKRLALEAQLLAEEEQEAQTQAQSQGSSKKDKAKAKKERQRQAKAAREALERAKAEEAARADAKAREYRLLAATEAAKAQAAIDAAKAEKMAEAEKAEAAAEAAKAKAKAKAEASVGAHVAAGTANAGAAADAAKSEAAADAVKAEAAAEADIIAGTVAAASAVPFKVMAEDDQLRRRLADADAEAFVEGNLRLHEYFGESWLANATKKDLVRFLQTETPTAYQRKVSASGDIAKVARKRTMPQLLAAVNGWISGDGADAAALAPAPASVFPLVVGGGVSAAKPAPAPAPAAQHDPCGGAAADRGPEPPLWGEVAPKEATWRKGFKKVLKQIYPSKKFAPEGRARTCLYVSAVADAIIQHCAPGLRGGTPFGTRVTQEHIHGSLDAVLTGELAKHAKREALKAARKYAAAVVNGSSVSGDVMWKFSHAGVKAAAVAVSGGATFEDAAAVYLAGVLEYMSAVVIELAGRQADADVADSRQSPLVAVAKFIDGCHVELAVAGDKELLAFFEEHMGASWGAPAPTAPGASSAAGAAAADTKAKEGATAAVKKAAAGAGGTFADWVDSQNNWAEQGEEAQEATSAGAAETPLLPKPPAAPSTAREAEEWLRGEVSRLPLLPPLDALRSQVSWLREAIADSERVNGFQPTSGWQEHDTHAIVSRYEEALSQLGAREGVGADVWRHSVNEHMTWQLDLAKALSQLGAVTTRLQLEAAGLEAAAAPTLAEPTPLPTPPPGPHECAPASARLQALEEAAILLSSRTESAEAARDAAEARAGELAAAAQKTEKLLYRSRVYSAELMGASEAWTEERQRLQDERQNAAQFIDKLQTKIDKLKQLAASAGADGAAIEEAMR